MKKITKEKEHVRFFCQNNGPENHTTKNSSWTYHRTASTKNLEKEVSMLSWGPKLPTTVAMDEYEEIKELLSEEGYEH